MTVGMFFGICPAFRAAPRRIRLLFCRQGRRRQVLPTPGSCFTPLATARVLESFAHVNHMKKRT